MRAASGISSRASPSGLLGSTSARIQITPLGAGSRWQIGDLYIDPWVNRIG
jgi:hypothetical protein